MSDQPEPIEVEIVLEATPKLKAFLDFIKDWDPALHPKDPDDGRFTDSGSGGVDRGQESGRMVGDDVPVAVRQPVEAPPANRPVHNPFIDDDSNGDGVTDAARVGVRAFDVPPPPPIGRLPNLSPLERKAEAQFADAFEADPDGYAREYIREISGAGKFDANGLPRIPTFSTDDAKLLDRNWNPGKDEKISEQERRERKAVLNIAVHGTANAIAKRAFSMYLEDVVAKLPQDQRSILVTAGGCGAGKGFALGNIEQMKALQGKSAAVWDAAGDQNSTENPWILQEAVKHKIVADFVWVNADPVMTWADSKRGVVFRATKEEEGAGRMIDASVYSDSYVLGARNFKNFSDKNPDHPNARFHFLQNGKTPEKLTEFPQSALDYDRRQLYATNRNYVLENAHLLPRAVVRGALAGDRIWQRRGRGRRAAAKSHREQGRDVGRAAGAGPEGRSAAGQGPAGAPELRGVAPGKAHPPAEGGAWRRWSARRALAKHFSGSLVTPRTQT